MISWSGSSLLISNSTKRERILLSLSGLAPDIDGVGLFVDLAAKIFGVTTTYWGQYHHALHSLPFGAIVAFAATVIAKERRVLVGVLALMLFHIHLLSDLVGSRGPDGYQWPILYLSPVNNKLALVWSGQWELNAWQNIIIAIIFLFITVYIIKIRNISPFEIVSEKMNKTLISLICKRMGNISD